MNSLKVNEAKPPPVQAVDVAEGRFTVCRQYPSPFFTFHWLHPTRWS